jgi:hypothetical protein
MKIWDSFRGLEWLKFISLFLSVISLLISAAVANVTVFRQLDELKIVINDSPSAIPKNNELMLYGPLSLSFVNSGNRTIEINDLALYVIQPPAETTQIAGCGYDRGPLAMPADYSLGDYYQPIDKTVAPEKPTDKDISTYTYWIDEKPFSIRANEISFKKYEISNAKKVLKHDQGVPLALTNVNRSQKGNATVCLEMRITSADKSLVSGMILSTDTWEYQNPRIVSGPSGAVWYFNTQGPVVILDDEHSIIFEWFISTYSGLKKQLAHLI